MSYIDGQLLGQLQALNAKFAQTSITSGGSGDLLLDVLNEIRLLRIAVSEFVGLDLTQMTAEFTADAVKQ